MPGSSRVVNPANALTVLRILLVPVFLLCFLADGQQYGGWRWAAVIVFVVATVTDKLDGDLARKYGWITDFGKIADPIADKLLLGTAMVTLSSLGELPWWMTVVILLREVGITVLRFTVLRYGVIPASQGGKWKTALQTLAVFLYILPVTPQVEWLSVLAWWVMLAAVILTVWTGVSYLVAAMRLRQEALADSATER